MPTVWAVPHICGTALFMSVSAGRNCRETGTSGKGHDKGSTEQIRRCFNEKEKLYGSMEQL